MDAQRRKELLLEWKNRRPEMGVISILCKATGDLFFGTSKDTRADFNSNRCKLSNNNHPNRRLQELWNEYGEAGFEFSTEKVLNYKDPADDHTEKLNELLEQCLTESPQAKKIWR